MYCGFIVALKDLRKHSNADRLQCANIFGNNIILDLSFKENQKVVFFPVDGQLNEEYAKANNLLRLKDSDGNNIGGYLDPEKRNIRAIKLRGEKSEGLVLPVETLSPYTDIDSLRIGDKVTILNGVEICKKYIPADNHKVVYNNGHVRTTRDNEYPIFTKHVETEQLMYNRDIFKTGDKCIISLKMHGTSGRTSYSIRETENKQKWYHKLLRKKPEVTRQWEYVSGSRNVVLDFTDNVNDNDYYGTNAFRKPYHDFFMNKLEKGESVYYEIVGYIDEDTPIMGSNKLKDKELKKMYGDTMVFSYGCSPGQNDIYVYRMTLTNEDGFTIEYSDALMRLRCEQLGVKCVPKFEEFNYSTWEDLIERVEKYYDGPDPIGKTHIREGVVVRIENREKFKVYKHKNFTFKLVSGLISDSIQTDNMSDDILSEL